MPARWAHRSFFFFKSLLPFLPSSCPSPDPAQMPEAHKDQSRTLAAHLESAVLGVYREGTAACS